MPACIPSVRSSDFLPADSATLHETEPPVCSEEDRSLLADIAAHVSMGSDESLCSVSHYRRICTPTRRLSFGQCSTVSGTSGPAQLNRGLKTGDKDSESHVQRQDHRAGTVDDGDPTCYRYVANCKNSRGMVLGDGRFTMPTRGQGRDEILSSSKILNNFDFGGSQRGKGDFWDNREPKRDCQHVRTGGRRDTSREDHERYHTESRKNDAKDCRVRADCDQDERRRHSRYNHYEDKRTHHTKLSTNGHGKSTCRENRRCQWREQNSCDGWKEDRSSSSDERSVKNDCRYKDRLIDYPSYRSSIESSFERQSDGPHQHRSDFTPRDLRRGCGVSGRRKHRDCGGWSGTVCDQNGYGTVDGYHNYPYYDYASLRSRYYYAYYEELYRTNPTYRQQVDAYYAHLGYRTSHRVQPTNVHSDIPFNYTDLPPDDSYVGNANYYCNPMVPDHAPRLEELKKFPRPHPIARFCGVSGLLKLVPTVSGRHVPPPIEIHSLRNLFRNDPQFHELQAFPGPLDKSETHKDDVIHFCKDKITSFAKDPILPDRSSHILLWELLLLMVRQNGFISGSDIAELLVRENEPSETAGVTSVLGDLPWSEEYTASTDKRTDHRGGDGTPPCEFTVASDSTSFGSSGYNRTTSKFREFLLFGRKKCALDWAAKHGLWDHALCLASKMDAPTYAAVMARFTNSLPVNDPLRTLYQHLSVRQSISVTCAAFERWGDWRPHLAMILSNPSSRPDVDARNIVTLGDSLASRGCVSAAHFCYLAARVEFGSFSCKSSKLVLLGSCHQTLSFREFASNDAIQATEIYEYARSLADTSYMLPHLQPYKFRLAVRFAEYGFVQEALHYCEVLAKAMTLQCWSARIAAETYELASRLKYRNANFIQKQGEVEEFGEPPWLAAFAQVMNEQLPPKIPSGTVVKDVDGFSNDDCCVGDCAQFMDGLTSRDTVQSQLHLTAECSLFNANSSNLQQLPGNYFSSNVGASAYWNKRQAETSSEEQSSPMPYATEDKVEQQPMSPISLVDYNKDSEPDQQWSSELHVTHETVQYDPTNLSPFIAPVAPAEDAGNMEPQMPIAAQPSREYDRFKADTPFASIESHVTAVSQPLNEDTPTQPPKPPSTEVGEFDYYKACTCSESEDPQQCWTSRENLRDKSSGKDASEQPDSSRHSRQPSLQSPAESCGTGRAKDQGKTTRKKWLVGAIVGAFEKLVPKGPNQMILPDDTEPAIVWDDQKKCWVDKNAAPGEMDGRLAAPPLDSSFGNRSRNTLENRFQMNKHRRRHYVDVLNASGKERSRGPIASSSLAPFLPQPVVTQAPPQFFVPGISEQHDTGWDFVSAPPPLAVRTASPQAPESPLSESPAPYCQPRAEANTTLTFDMA